MYGIIYKVTGPTGLVYIGQTTYSLKRRKAHHKCMSLKGDRRNTFQVALLEHGFSSFVWEQIDQADDKISLDQKEKHWIAHYQSDNPAYGYNGTDGGINPKHTPETRKKISEAKKGKPNGWEGKQLSEEHRRKIGKAHKGRIISAEQRQKQRLAMTGRKPSPETCRKRSEAMKAFYASEENRRKQSERMKKCSGCGWSKGKKLSPEHREKISAGLKGHAGWNKGKKLAPEHRQKISNSLIGNQRGKGKTPWNKGKSKHHKPRAGPEAP